MRRMNENDQGNEQGDFGNDDDVYVQLFFFVNSLNVLWFLDEAIFHIMILLGH